MVYAAVQLSFMGVSLGCVGSGGLLQIGELLLVVPSGEKGGGISFSGCIQLIGFCTFEACGSIFWPSIMKMRSQYIPEEARSTTMNFFSIPLIIFVCIVLYNVWHVLHFPLCSISFAEAAQGHCREPKKSTRVDSNEGDGH